MNEQKLHCNYCRKKTPVKDNDCTICGFSFTNTELDKLGEPSEDYLEKMRKASHAIYLACECRIAEEISEMLRWAVNRLEHERKELEKAKEKIAALAMDVMFKEACIEQLKKDEKSK